LALSGCGDGAITPTLRRCAWLDAPLAAGARRRLFFGSTEVTITGTSTSGFAEGM
jgi:hypothetical protein